MIRLRMKTFTLIFLLSLCVSCGATTPVKKDPAKVAPHVESEFRSAQTLAKNGDSKKAVPKLKKFVQGNPSSEFTAEAYYLLGVTHQNAQQWNEALTDFGAIINLDIANPYEVEASLRSARIQLKLGRPADADKSLEHADRWKKVSAEQNLELQKLNYEIGMALKQNLRALRAAIFLAENGTNATEKEKFKTTALESVDSRFSLDELVEIGDSSAFSLVRPHAKFRCGLLMAEQHQYSKARSYFNDAASLAPGTELADRANTFVRQIDSRNRVDSRAIGVVLPLSGKQSSIAYKALKGIQLGLGIYGDPNGDNSGFRLAVIDSEGNPDVARAAIERLVQEDNVIAVIGGLLSKTANAEASRAQEFGVPAIMLSQKAGVTQAGDFVFRNALTSQMQIQQLVDTAMGKMGMRNFAVLYPNDAYGVEFANLFWDAVRAKGGDIRGAQPYDPAETDFRGYVQRLVGTFYLEDRTDEYRLMAKTWAEKNPKRSGQKSAPTPEDLLPPIVDFDAIFIPDSVKAVGQIAPMLAYNNVNNVKLLGTNLWNNSGLLARGQRFVEGSIFVDSFLSSDPAFTGSEFYTTFKAAFEEEPGLTELQAFDSALLLRQLIASGEITRAGLQARMAKLTNFPGGIGPLSVDSEREIHRPVSALTVKDGHITGLEMRRK
jgi:branched-chain amino acid transport system substrate-binding protein